MICITVKLFDSLRTGRSEDRIPVRQDFPHQFKPTLGPSKLPVQVPGVKRSGRGVDHPPSCNAMFSYSSHLGHHCLFKGKLYLLFVKFLRGNRLCVNSVFILGLCIIWRCVLRLCNSSFLQFV